MYGLGCMSSSYDVIKKKKEKVEQQLILKLVAILKKKKIVVAYLYLMCRVVHGWGRLRRGRSDPIGTQFGFIRSVSLSEPLTGRGLKMFVLTCKLSWIQLPISL